MSILYQKLSDLYTVCATFTFFVFFLTVPSVGICEGTDKHELIAVHECEPFVILDDTSEKGYSGLSIYLLDQIAQKRGFDYTLKEYSLQGMLDAVERGEAASGVSCTSITPERETFVDFSHSFFETHLAIATRELNPVANLLHIFLNKKFIKAIGIIFLLSTLISLFLWFFEHRVNNKLYTSTHGPGKVIEALLPGLLCVTKGPPAYWNLETLPGRMLVALGAITSTFIIAGVTALIASVLTTQQLKGEINGPQDLHNVRVGVLQNSTSSRYLDKIEVAYEGYDSVDAMLVDLAAKTIDAVVEDVPVLRYLLKKGRAEGKFKRIVILPSVFEKQNYGFVLPEDHQFHEELNRALLEVRRESGWRALQDFYFKEQK